MNLHSHFAAGMLTDWLRRHCFERAARPSGVARRAASGG